LKEHDIQRQLVNYVRLAHKDVYIFAIPNGGHRHVAVATKLKAEGVSAGVADLCLIHRGIVAFVEVKASKGRMSYKQVEFAEMCIMNDIPHYVVRDLDGMVRIVEEIKQLAKEKHHANNE